jgi:ParB/Sulfiredoxin domain
MSESLTALFDAVDLVRHPVHGLIERVPLDQLELAPNHRKAIDREGIHRLAHMLASTGQLTPCIGRRVAQDRVVIYAGQRRLLAARASHELAGSPDFEGLAPVTSLIVLLFDHEPGDDEIRRIQAQENAREPLSLRDQQEQFRDCWQARAGLPDADRIAVVRADLGITHRQGPPPTPPTRAPRGDPRPGRRAARR